MRPLLFVLTAGLIAAALPSAAAAQTPPGYDELRQGGPDRPSGAAGAGSGAAAGAAAGKAALTEGGAAVRIEQTFGDGVGFMPGRDNLGFPNLSGALQLGGMAGNCYTMAVVAKLFFEKSRFTPSKVPYARKRGFSLDALATLIGSGGTGTLDVLDFASLFDMSYESGFGESEAFAEIARQRGIDVSAKDKVVQLRGRRQMIVQLVQIISTIHYLHYMQYQAGSFLEAILRQKLAGGAAVRAVTVREVGSMAARLAQKRTALLLMLNVGQVYGHVVLAYRISRSAAADYIEVYDSNVQHGEEIRPSVLKVSRDGRVLGYFRQEADGKLEPHSLYDGDRWFSDRENLAIVDLPDLSLSAENMRTLGQKVKHADTETAYLMAGGQLLRDLTESPPETTSLRDATLGFLRNAQAIDGTPAADRLPRNAGAETINKFLAAHTDAAVRTAFPYALPRGVTLTETRIKLDPANANKADLHTILTLERDGPVHHLVGVLQESAALSGYRALAEWVDDTRNNVGPTRIRVEVDLGLTKQRMPEGLAMTYGLMPEVRRSHVVLGDIPPGTRLAAAHQMEISKPALRGGLKTAVGRIGFLGNKYEFGYTLIPARYSPGILGDQIQLTPEIKRKGWGRIDAVDLDLIGPPPSGGVGKLRLIFKGSSFIAINPVMADRGVSGKADPVNCDIQIYTYAHLPGAQWVAFAEVDGKLRFDDGVWNLLSGSVLKFANQLFPFLQGQINTYVRGSLTDYVTLVKPLEVASLSVSTTKLAVKSNEVVFDVEALARQLFHFESPVAIKNVRIASDRIVIGIDPK